MYQNSSSKHTFLLLFTNAALFKIASYKYSKDINCVWGEIWTIYPTKKKKKISKNSMEKEIENAIRTVDEIEF